MWDENHLCLLSAYDEFCEKKSLKSSLSPEQIVEQFTGEKKNDRLKHMQDVLCICKNNC